MEFSLRFAPQQPERRMPSRVLVFDFDGTITSPIYLERLKTWVVADKVKVFAALTRDEIIANLGGEARVEALRALFADLRSDERTALFVCSLGYKTAIVPNLTAADLLSAFGAERVFGQDSPELARREFKKADFIRDLVCGMDLPASAILFIDDSAQHVEYARATKTCDTLHVDGGKGLTESHMATIREWARRP